MSVQLHDLVPNVHTDVKQISLPYIDIQKHDALAVLDDVQQATVLREDIWVSAYKSGSEEVHGRVRVEAKEGGGVGLTALGGVKIEQHSKTHLVVSCPALNIEHVPVKFPKQVIRPPFKKTNTVSSSYIDAFAISPNSSRIAIAGPNGDCVILPTSPDARSRDKVELKGHVADISDIRWFPSGGVDRIIRLLYSYFQRKRRQ
ncbi:MAG: hypothetical protein TREMPRED_004159 [Tremellales sp. Tagirdzhanova-0007]|nr:MAG: hypothetical protein TREMPRED_004159 [Tremellales sp. Tagirdzhanova-0007]